MLRLLISILLLFSFSPAAAQTVTSSAAQRQDITIVTGNRQKAPVARAFAQAPRATSDCLMSAAAGVQMPLFGASASFSQAAEHCNCREDAKVYEDLGEHEKAIVIMNWCNRRIFKPDLTIEYKYPRGK